MSAFEVYVLVMLDSLQMAFGIGLIVTGIAGIMVILLWALATDFEEEIKKKAARISKGLAAPFLLLFLLATFTPNTKQAAAIYLLPKLTNNQEIQELGQDSVKLLRGHLDKWLEELGPRTR